ncbi:hypothetical protein C8Q76DRAFT_716670 [Earliella scabrosa]|nr:hypothetical protein C8Q76DRAFT_716670 [Earliella scabrosa]
MSSSIAQATDTCHRRRQIPARAQRLRTLAGVRCARPFRPLGRCARFLSLSRGPPTSPRPGCLLDHVSRPSPSALCSRARAMSVTMHLLVMQHLALDPSAVPPHAAHGLRSRPGHGQQMSPRHVLRRRAPSLPCT